MAAIKEKFVKIFQNASTVLAINQRNLLYVYPNNSRHHFPLADDKLKTKECLVAAGVPMPETYKTYSNFYELTALADDLSCYGDFVIKPSKGRAGGGIIAISGRENGLWKSMGGHLYSIDNFRKHISDIIFGVYSFDLHDQAILEERVIQHPEVEKLSPYGLADIRLILLRGKLVLSMIRVPTLKSDGRANLHQGAIGIGLDLDSGITTHALWQGDVVDRHPDTDTNLLGLSIPYWQEIVNTARLAARSVPLQYIGADVSVGLNGPVLLEINVRPGLEIQNVNRAGMMKILEALDNEYQQEVADAF